MGQIRQDARIRGVNPILAMPGFWEHFELRGAVFSSPAFKRFAGNQSQIPALAQRLVRDLIQSDSEKQKVKKKRADDRCNDLSLSHWTIVVAVQ